MSSRTNGAAITQDRVTHDHRLARPAGLERVGASYLPGLDGLRALAIIAVLIFHANARWLPGGFLGVDLFFVISGFIITRALLAEWDARGRVDIGQFWMRRARRLLPAVFLLISSALMYCAFFERSDVSRLRQDTLAALAYATNWYQISGGQSYFASLAPPSLLQHLWSLAVEEQFYLVWPLLLSAALVVLPRRALAPLLVLGAAASTLEMALLYQHGASVSRLYYGTDTRAAGLLIGSALALSPMLWTHVSASRRWPVARQACGWLSLGLLAALCLSIDDNGAILYNGGFAVVSLASAGLIVAAIHPAALLSRILERAPLRWLGRRSYGIYLWHWPIFVLMQPHLSITGGAALVSAGQIALAIAIAAISYRFLEEPIRHGALTRMRHALRRQLRRRTFAMSWGLGMSAGMVIFLAIWIVRVPAPALPSYFALTHVQITSAAATATPTAPPVLAVAPTAPAPTATPIRQAPTARAVLPPATPTPLTGDVASSDSSSASSASSASLVYAPTPAATMRALPPASSARVTAIGDSVMLGAAQQLAAVTPGIYVDAAVGRQVSAAIALLQQLRANGQLGGILLIDMGNNGTFTDAQFDEIMAIAGPARRVVFVNLKEPRSWEAANNAVITRGVARYANAVLVDWHDASINRPELFWSDLIHLRPEGANVYAHLIAPYVSG